MFRLRATLAALAVLSILAIVTVPTALAAATGASIDSLTVATALVVAWGWLAPVTIYQWIPATDARMKGITIAFSLAVAALALFLSGGLHADFSSAAGVYSFSLLVYGEQQLVWTLLKDQPRTAGLVTTPLPPVQP